MDDTRLEDSLRRALHEEADALPFTITVDDLDVRLAQRPRPVSRLGILSAAAAVVIVVGAGALLANQGPASTVGNSPQPTASPTADDSLDSFDQMVAYTRPGGLEVLRAEFLDGAPGDDDIVSTTIGSVAEAGFYQVLYDCSGPGPFTVSWHDPGSAEVLTAIEVPSCEGPMAAFTSPEHPADSSLRISAPRATNWRVLAYEPHATLPGSTSPGPAGT